MSADYSSYNNALIASLFLEDISSIQDARKGKAQDGTPLTDEEVVFQLYAEEADHLLALSRDGILAASIDRAVEADRTLLRAYALSEAQDARDRNMAFYLSGQRPPSASSFTSANDIVALSDTFDALSVRSEYVFHGYPQYTVNNTLRQSETESTSVQASSSRVQLPPRMVQIRP